ncbi:hypothetical protein [Streptomyces atratus]|uniref:hypothetical protein n=1 Tax=Streptomyces atratus TaxID=1893 RepID=UPI000931A583|nr:hypothetical protein [Streptomyces atratus]
MPLPPCAAEIVAAHLAHRRAEGSGTRGPCFTDTTQPELPAIGRALRPMTKRTCRRLGIDPFWMHRASAATATPSACSPTTAAPTGCTPATLTAISSPPMWEHL